MDLDAQRGARIRDARERLDFSQQKMADAIGIRREMWAKYEAGAEPGAKALAAMAQAGVDVLYILTGQRSQGVPKAALLPARQRELLENYEATDEEGRRAIEATALVAARASAPDAHAKPVRRKAA